MMWNQLIHNKCNLVFYPTYDSYKIGLITNKKKQTKYLVMSHLLLRLNFECFAGRKFLWFEEQTDNCENKDEYSYGSYDGHCNGMTENPSRVRSHVEGGLTSWFLILLGTNYTSTCANFHAILCSFLCWIYSWEPKCCFCCTYTTKNSLTNSYWL